MHDLTSFEQRLAQRLEIELSASVRPFTPARIALDAMGARGRRDGILRRLGLGDRIGSPVFAQAQRIAVAGLLLLALAVAAVTVGMLLQPKQLPLDPRLALVRENGDLVIANPDGSDAVVIAGSPFYYRPTTVLWAPDGQHLALRNGLFDLAVVDLEGRVTMQTSFRGSSSEIAWSPDGQRLAILDGLFEESRGAGSVIASLEIMGPNGEEVWTVPVPAAFGIVIPPGKLAWSPDGRTIAVTAFNTSANLETFPTHLWLADTVERTFRQVTHDDAIVEYGPAWSAGGELFVARRGPLETGIWRVDIASGEMERLLRTAGSLCGSGAPMCDQAALAPLIPSPDGARIVFSDPIKGLSVLDVASGGVRNLVAARSVAYGPFTWSEDGTSLLLIVGPPSGPGDEWERPDLVRLDVLTGAQIMIVPDITGYSLLQE